MARRTRRSPRSPLLRRSPGLRRSPLLRLSPLFEVAALGLFSALALWGGDPGASALPRAGDREQARFARCVGPVRETCVVDGDTFWYRGAKIRVADINAPEISAPRCAAEARLGARATRRLTALLNEGPFSLEPADRATDVYGRRLYVVTRAGESLGAALTAEGLAEPWHGHRGDWC